MIKKAIKKVRQNLNNHELINSMIVQSKVLNDQCKELEWANIYHDSIRGKKWIEELSLNVGRWAGNYSFFYVLNRILTDYKPKKILDLGLGESSKFISQYLDNYLFESHHTIIEQDEIWIEAFNNRFALSQRSKLIHCPLDEINIKGFKSYAYKGFEEIVHEKFDLYIIDGPFGSDRYSRYDIIKKINELSLEDEFIILFDDANRKGEQDTVNDAISILNNKGINTYIGNYEGLKAQTIIATQNYKFVISL